MRIRRIAAAALSCSIAAAMACGSDEPANDASPWVCEPSSPSPSDAFAAERNPTSEQVQLAKAIADRTIAVHEPTELHWDWAVELDDDISHGVGSVILALLETSGL